jgi:hypothetical protein
VREQIRRLVAVLPAAERADFHDLSDLYDGVVEGVFIDSIHTQQEFQPRVAEALAEIVAPRVRGGGGNAGAPSREGW